VSLRQLIWAVLCVVVGFLIARAHAHEIYTGLKDKQGQLCCGSDDCEPTHYRIEHGEAYAFLTRENHWVVIPKDRITFLPVPGDDDWSKDTDPEHRAHLCYRKSEDLHGNGPTDEYVSEDGQQFIHLYCAWIPPGSI